MVEALPSGNGDDAVASSNDNEIKSKDPNAILPSAEAYESQNREIDVLIRNLKEEIKGELRDEIQRLEYLLTEKEKQLRIKELELQQKEAELNVLRSRLEAIENNQQNINKEVPSEDSELGELNEEERTLIAGQRSINNPSGRGGLPGSVKSSSILIDRHSYRGDKLELGDGSDLVWDQGRKSYELVGKNQGIKFTYFAVEAAYLNEHFINPNYPQFYSQSILRKQIWYDRAMPGKLSAGIGEQYRGKVPLDLLKKMLNERVNAAYINPNSGELVENQPFELAYKNWRYKYEAGTFFRNKDGDLYGILDETSSDSRGNAPSFRTDDFGNQTKTSKTERSKWKGNLGSSRRTNK